ncbi:MAG TPA: hypothetical protein DCQ93_00200 [Bacteroidetes bacterium]|nr:hypothetical protein [Bacteroidota bacterium]
MEKVKYFLLGGIFTATILLVFQSFTPGRVGKHCDDDQRYSQSEQAGGGKSISVQDANDFVDAFQSRFTEMNGRKGFYISKRAIDALFDSDERGNGLVCCPAYTSSGEISMVLCTAISDNSRATDNTTGVYITEGFCPNICGVFNQ